MGFRNRRLTSGTYGSDNSNVMGEHFCDCGLRALLQISNIVANLGREYYLYPVRRCIWFRWADPSNQCQRVNYIERGAEDCSCDVSSKMKLNERL